MAKAFIIAVCAAAFLVGCKRLGLAPGETAPNDGMTAAQYNWWLIASALWPVAMPLIKNIPGVGPVAGLIADALWALTATKKQKDAEKV